jgi:hypothetical protein
MNKTHWGEPTLPSTGNYRDNLCRSDWAPVLLQVYCCNWTPPVRTAIAGWSPLGVDDLIPRRSAETSTPALSSLNYDGAACLSGLVQVAVLGD